MSFLEFEWNNRTLKIDKMLAEVLASLVYNVEQDWDFVVIITGDRTVRTGKSVLAMTCCAFMAYLLKKLKLNDNAFDENHIFWEGAKMMDKAQDFGKYNIVQMDEARESLAASKTAQQLQQNVLDFYAECGQLRNISVLVMPDYFEMKEVMGVARSEILINVFRDTTVVHKDFMGDGIQRPIVMFKRGFFKLYNRNAKAMLYDIFRTTRRKDYNSVKPSFPVGQFLNQYPIDEDKYRSMKADALARFKERHEKKEDKKLEESKKQLGLTIKMLEELGIKQKDIADKLNLSRQTVAKFKKEYEQDSLFDNKQDTGYVEPS